MTTATLLPRGAQATSWGFPVTPDIGIAVLDEVVIEKACKRESTLAMYASSIPSANHDGDF